MLRENDFCSTVCDCTVKTFYLSEYSNWRHFNLYPVLPSLKIVSKSNASFERIEIRLFLFSLNTLQKERKICFYLKLCLKVQSSEFAFFFITLLKYVVQLYSNLWSLKSFHLCFFHPTAVIKKVSGEYCWLTNLS